MVDLLGLIWDDFLSFRRSLHRDDNDERIPENVKGGRGEQAIPESIAERRR